MISAIHVQDVSKRFGRRKVVDQVTFEVPQGVVFALLGENGAGKSTLIRSMLGYHKIDGGHIEVCGLDPRDSPLEIRRRVGYVSDAPGLYEWMTIAQAGWYAAGFYPPGFLKTYGQLLYEFQLPPDAKIRDLSKGMRAKVALSLAMAFDPQLLILDEPTSGLDPLVRRSFLESMIDRAAAGQTVFLSSHQMHEVERVADWVAILHEGKLQIVAPLEELKSSVRVLNFAMRDPLLALPPEFDQLDIVHQSQAGRTHHAIVRGLTPAIEAALVQHVNLFEVKVVRPNLEELYLGFTQPLTAPSQLGSVGSSAWSRVAGDRVDASSSAAKSNSSEVA
ncbi:MAG: ABC transporter ATP-binding protein [Pirellulaceae bacterium]|nr:ABC transporter ATP-binding protein [Pirellulaceae bacterium]